MVDQEVTVGPDQITAEAMEGQVTAAVGRDINETVDLARGQKMDIRNTIVVMDGSLRIGEWLKKSWVEGFALGMRYII